MRASPSVNGRESDTGPDEVRLAQRLTKTSVLPQPETRMRSGPSMLVSTMLAGHSCCRAKVLVGAAGSGLSQANESEATTSHVANLEPDTNCMVGSIARQANAEQVRRGRTVFTAPAVGVLVAYPRLRSLGTVVADERVGVVARAFDSSCSARSGSARVSTLTSVRSLLAGKNQPALGQLPQQLVSNDVRLVDGNRMATSERTSRA